MSQKVNALGDLRKLKVRLKDDVVVSRAGSHYKARLRGHANCVFGDTPEAAALRLRGAQSKLWGFAPAPITNMERLLMAGMR